MTHHEWGWMIVVYLFLGGLGAGSLVLAAAAHLSRRRAFVGIARAGALAAPVLVGAGSGLLIFDLGRPLNFWRLFVTVNPVSPMSVGSWLLILFSGIATGYAVLHLPPEWLERAALRAGRLAPALRRLAAWNRPAPLPSGVPRAVGSEAATFVPFPDSPGWVAMARDAFAVAGIPLGVGVGIYTGILLGAIPARPFWNTPMVAQLFLFSALSTATALLLMLAPGLRALDPALRRREHDALIRADLVFIFFELFLIIPFVIHGELSTRSARAALELVLGGPYTVVFWGGVVALGILLPMAIEVVELAGGLRRAPRSLARTLHVLVPTLILAGGYLLRWIFVHAGQDSQFLP